MSIGTCMRIHAQAMRISYHLGICATNQKEQELNDDWKESFNGVSMHG